MFWTVIVEGKQGLQGETNFDFKYVPNLHKITTLEGVSNTGLRNHGIERRYLQIFLIACSLLVLMVYTSLCTLMHLLDY